MRLIGFHCKLICMRNRPICIIKWQSFAHFYSTYKNDGWNLGKALPWFSLVNICSSDFVDACVKVCFAFRYKSWIWLSLEIQPFNLPFLCRRLMLELKSESAWVCHWTRVFTHCQLPIQALEMDGSEWEMSAPPGYFGVGHPPYPEPYQGGPIGPFPGGPPFHGPGFVAPVPPMGPPFVPFSGPPRVPKFSKPSMKPKVTQSKIVIGQIQTQFILKAFPSILYCELSINH